MRTDPTPANRSTAAPHPDAPRSEVPRSEVPRGSGTASASAQNADSRYVDVDRVGAYWQSQGPTAAPTSQVDDAGQAARTGGAGAAGARA